MSEKTLRRKPLAELLEVVRTHCEGDPLDREKSAERLARKMELEREMFQDDLFMGLHLSDLVFGSYWFKHDVTLDELVKVLDVLGWKVADDEPAEC